MGKDAYYFSHDYHARNDEKILELRLKYGAEGYGLFWMIVETMAENENGGAKASLMGGLSLGYGVTKERLLDFVEYCISIELFYKEDGFIFSRRMKKHKDFRQELSKKGKEGAEKRWKNSPPNSPPIATPMQRKGKERKGKESKTFNTRPTFSDFNGLPEQYYIQSIELIGITKKTRIDKDTVKSMWEIFKTQSLTGDEYYPNEGKVYSHFLNWIKKQDFSSISISSNNSMSKLDAYKGRGEQ